MTIEFRRLIAILAVPVLTGLSGAAGYAAALPNSGTVLEGSRPPAVAPAEERPTITIEGQEPGAPVGDPQRKIPIKAFRIGGEPPLPESELLPLVSGEAGREITLGRLNELADRIAKYLQQKGYLAASAFIPAQDVADGAVEIIVRPGRYGQIKIENRSQIDSRRIEAMLFAVRPGMIVNRRPLERALRLVSDLSDSEITARLKRGKEAGTADLYLEFGGDAKVRGQVYVDNWGNYYTGRFEYGTQMAINNFGGRGDSLYIGGMTTGQGVNNYLAGYSVPLGYDGLKVEVGHSRASYRVGKEMAYVGANGWATTTSYSLSYPFVRVGEASLFGSVGYGVKHLRDDVAGFGSYSPRTSSLWSLGLNGDFADRRLGGGLNEFSLTRYRGKLSFTSAEAQADDAATARKGGSFAKTVLTYKRKQYVAKNLDLNFSFAGQLAGKNLDDSEKLSLGGADGVRAFGQGEASGDQGCKLSGELSWRLPGLSDARNVWHLNAFYDYGSVILNKRPPSGPDPNRRSLMGAGLGLAWDSAQGFTVRLEHAWKIGRDPAAPDSGFTWLQMLRCF